jgi:hypothetical protein
MGRVRVGRNGQSEVLTIEKIAKISEDKWE